MAKPVKKSGNQSKALRVTKALRITVSQLKQAGLNLRQYVVHDSCAAEHNSEPQLARAVIDQANEIERLRTGIAELRDTAKTIINDEHRRAVSDIGDRLADEIAALDMRRGLESQLAAMTAARDQLAEIAEQNLHCIENVMCAQCRAMIDTPTLESIDELRAVGVKP